MVLAILLLSPPRSPELCDTDTNNVGSGRTAGSYRQDVAVSINDHRPCLPFYSLQLIRELCSRVLRGRVRHELKSLSRSRKWSKHTGGESADAINPDANEMSETAIEHINACF